MELNLLNLPRNIFDSICKYTHDKYLLRLRKVSKLGKEMVDLSALNTRVTKMEQVNVFGNFERKRDITFSFDSVRDYSMWKNCFNHVINRLGVVEFSKVTDSDKSLAIDMKEDEVERFLEYLKPLIRAAQFSALCIWNAHPNTLRIFTAFLESKSFSSVSILQALNVNSFPFFDFAQALKPEFLAILDFHISLGSIEILKKLADIVGRICISVRNHASIADHLVVSLARDMLSRKCYFLRFHDRNNGTITLDDAEHLLQIFNHMEKEVSFFTRTSDRNLRNCQIGEYRMELTATTIPGTRNVSIEHFNKF